MSSEEPARVRDTPLSDDERQFESTVRPSQLAEYIGQRQVKENLRVYMKAARNRKEALDHVLLTGPPGLGKTTLAHIIANEMGAELRSTAGPPIRFVAFVPRYSGRSAGLDLSVSAAGSSKALRPSPRYCSFTVMPVTSAIA